MKLPRIPRCTRCGNRALINYGTRQRRLCMTCWMDQEITER